MASSPYPPGTPGLVVSRPVLPAVSSSPEQLTNLSRTSHNESSALALPHHKPSAWALPHNEPSAWALPHNESLMQALPYNETLAWILPHNKSFAWAMSYNESSMWAMSHNESSAWTLPPDRLTPFDILHIKVIFIVLYTTVFLLCVIGNVLVIYVVLRHQKMRTTTNFFLGNLAAADLSVGVFCIIPNLLLYLSPYWYLGKVMCKLLYFVQMMSYAASITILTVISVERYFAILHPLRCKTWTRLWLLRLAVLVIWLASALTGLPQLLLRDAVTTSGLSFCIVANVQFNRQAYVTANFVVWYLVPLCLMSLMYSKISLVLWNTSKLDRMSTNALRHWRHHKKVKYAYKGRTEKEGYINGQTCTSTGPRISIEEEYPNRSSSEEEAQPAEEGGRRGSGGSATGGVNGETCPDLLSVATTSLQVTPEEEPLNCGLLAYKDVVPPRKGSNANPNKLSPVKPSLSSLIRQLSTEGAPAGPGPDRDTGVQCRVPATPQPPRVSGWDKLRATVKGPLLQGGGWPLQRSESALLARRRVVRLLLVLVACFAVCVLPYHVQMLVNEWGHAHPSFLQELLNPITFLVFYANSALNPLLYAFLSDNFRKSLCELVRGNTRPPPPASRPTTTPKTGQSAM